MTRHLMLVCALVLAGLAGANGQWWAVLAPVPHLLAWAWLRACTNLPPEIDENAPQFGGAVSRYLTSRGT